MLFALFRRLQFVGTFRRNGHDTLWKTAHGAAFWRVDSLEDLFLRNKKNCRLAECLTLLIKEKRKKPSVIQKVNSIVFSNFYNHCLQLFATILCLFSYLNIQNLVLQVSKVMFGNTKGFFLKFYLFREIQLTSGFISSLTLSCCCCSNRRPRELSEYE